MNGLTGFTDRSERDQVGSREPIDPMARALVGERWHGAGRTAVARQAGPGSVRPMR